MHRTGEGTVHRGEKPVAQKILKKSPRKKIKNFQNNLEIFSGIFLTLLGAEAPAAWASPTLR